MRHPLLGLILALSISPAWAQNQNQGNQTCPTRPFGDNSNACASTAFVQGALGFMPTKAVTGAYTFLASDNGFLVTDNNAGPVTDTLPAAQAAGWFVVKTDLGAGTATVTPAVGTINNNASQAIVTGDGYFITSDGVNYQAMQVGNFNILSGDIATSGRISTFYTRQGQALNVQGNGTVTAANYFSATTHNYLPAVTHVGGNFAAVGISTMAPGSAVGSADLGLVVAANQINYLTTSTAAEFDTVFAATTQGVNSTGNALTLQVTKRANGSNVAAVQNQAIELSTVLVNGSGQGAGTLAVVHSQQGQLDVGNTNFGFGVVSEAEVGAWDSAFLTDTFNLSGGTAGAVPSWQYVLRARTGRNTANNYFFITGDAHPNGPGNIVANGKETIMANTAIPVGGTTGAGYKFSSTTNYGVFFGSGAPTLAAAQGSIYLRSDGTVSTGVYYNTTGSTTWAAISGGGGGTPGGSNTQVQFNSSGAFGGSANLTWVSPTLTIGVAASATGQLAMTGATSGTVTITPQATAGTPTLTLPNATGTFAVTATGPLALSATTGNLTCLTCATTTNGGTLTATAPIAISAGGVISMTSPLPVANGGTNAGNLGTTGNFLYNNGTNVAGANVWRTTASQTDLSNGTTAVAERIYNSTDNNGGTPTNSSYLTLDWTTTANTATVQTVATGTGITADLVLNASSGVVRVAAASVFSVNGGSSNGFRVNSGNINLGSTSAVGFTSGAPDAAGPDTFLTRVSAAVLRQGAADAASPIAQTLQVQSVSGGTSNVAGATWTEQLSLSTGTGAAGTKNFNSGFAGVSTSLTVTISNASPAVFTITGHGYVPGQVLQFTTTGTLPTGLSLATNYFVISAGLTANSFEVSASPGGAAVNTSSAGSGTHTSVAQVTVQNAASTIATWGPSGLTGSQTTPALHLFQTWNTTSTPTAIQLDLTDINHTAFSSGLISLNVNGTAKFNVLAEGVVNGNKFATIGGNAVMDGNFVSVGSNGGMAFNGDVGCPCISDDNASTTQLALRNGANAQAWRVYNTADAGTGGITVTNYERGAFDWTSNSNTLTIGTQAGGTGTTRSIWIGAGASISNSVMIGHAVATPNVVIDDSANNFRIAGGMVLGWVNGSFAQSALTVGIANVAAKVVSFSDGAANANGWIQWGGQGRATSDTSFTSNATPAAISGLSATLQAGRTYSFEAELYFTTGATAGGIQVQVGGSATVTSFIADGYAIDGTTLIAGTRVSALSTNIIANTNAGTTPKARITGTITVNAAGTINIKFAQNVSNATASVIKQGSYLWVHDMP